MLGSETVLVGAEVELDENNDPIDSTSSAVPVEGCHVEPLTTEDVVALGRSGTTTGVRVYLPITSGVDGDKVLTVRGAAYFVEGDPVPFVDDEDPELSGYVVTALSAKG